VCKARLRIVLFGLIALFASYVLHAQSKNDSIAEIELKEVSVTALRQRIALERVPAALSISSFSSDYEGAQRSLQEYLYQVPGLIALNSSNYAQDLRISIRGFGARAAFGIRGIKLVIDNIPETTPDGQGQLDNLPLDLIETIAVLRGPSSLRYGNASGGVISIDTREDLTADRHRLTTRIGAFGQTQFTYSSALQLNKGGLLLHLSHQDIEGYRVHSRTQTSLANLKYVRRFSKASKWVIQANYTDSPMADDPGAINLEDFNADPFQARSQNVAFGAGESIRHYKVGGSLNHRSAAHELTTYGFFSGRNFEGFLPFADGGAVVLDRFYAGQGSSLRWSFSKEVKVKHDLMVGYDWAHQRDHRRRYENLSGSRGALNLDQDEGFVSLGSYLLYELKTSRLLFQGGLRYDRNKLQLEDFFRADEVDDSDAINLNAMSPQMGFSFQLNPELSVFVNGSKAYETPALSELITPPYSTSGFNQDLGVQETEMLELGVNRRASYSNWEVVLFTGKTINDIVPYELVAYPGRSFYRNAGQTKRSGIEFAYQRQFNRFNLDLVYAYLDLRLAEDSEPEVANRHLPGVPWQSGSLRLAYQASESIRLNYQRVRRGALYADDENLNRVEGFWLDHISLQKKWTLTSLSLAATMGVQNIANVRYADNIRINAFGSRYYELGLPRQVYIGINMSL
jgi:iron complex outermembrane receptor protein